MNYREKYSVLTYLREANVCLMFAEDNMDKLLSGKDDPLYKMHTDVVDAMRVISAMVVELEK